MSIRGDLAAYYEEEARLGSRGPVGGRRLALRSAFIEVLASEARSSVIDFGAGPGRDGSGFLEAGVRYLGIDLAPGNAALAAEREIAVLPASITAPPLVDHCFDAGWSMSTVMHLPADEVAAATRAMSTVLRPAAPLIIGLWGGDGGDYVDETQLPGQRRYFGLRSPDHNRQLLSSAADVEDEQIWDAGPDGWHYQVFFLRTRAEQQSC